jgi:hypothetical protein
MLIFVKKRLNFTKGIPNPAIALSWNVKGIA